MGVIWGKTRYKKGWKTWDITTKTKYQPSTDIKGVSQVFGDFKCLNTLEILQALVSRFLADKYQLHLFSLSAIQVRLSWSPTRSFKRTIKRFVV